jgi:hypothetical protein
MCAGIGVHGDGGACRCCLRSRFVMIARLIQSVILYQKPNINNTGRHHDADDAAIHAIPSPRNDVAADDAIPSPRNDDAADDADDAVPS